MNRPEAVNHLTIVCALACEAKPLIDLLQLRKTERTPYARYCGDIDGRPVNLLVSGIGANNMRSAVCWLQEFHPDWNNAWLNLGIAGNQCLEVGELVLVHCVSDNVSERRHYPPLVVPHEGISRPLLSCDDPCTEYPDSALVDMEGAAFFSAAVKSSSAELVQSLKVVSDNQSSGPERLTAQKISDLVYPHAAAIRQFAIQLFDLAPQPFLTPSDLEVGHLHLSVSHRHQVERLYHQLSVLNAVDRELQHQLKASTSADQVLNLMRDRLTLLVPALS